MKRRTTVEELELANPTLLSQERLIVEVTEKIAEALEASGLNQSELARRMGRSKAFVSQILSGGRNLTLRTLADVAWALDADARVLIRSKKSATLLTWPGGTAVSQERWPCPSSAAGLEEDLAA
jgi:transcriptional regulator with XRE-family HTH domain